jgi:menaquinone-9 beta-reductase
MSNSFRNVCVIGGGPAGLAAAIALKNTGREVTVFDCAVPPVDKACGEGLMPDSIESLRQLGINVPAELGFPFRGIRFTNGCSSVASDFPNGTARGVRRTALHKLLIERATKAGVSLAWNAKHLEIADAGIRVDGRLTHADLIVGADGQNSIVRRQAGLDAVAHETRRYGFRRHYQLTPWSSYMELHWGPRSQVYVTPVAKDEVCVVAISRDSKLRLNEALTDFPELTRRLHDAEPVSAETGALSVSRRLRSVHQQNIVLIGDASGSVDAITGEGICVSTKQAKALAEAVERGDLRQYGRDHRKLMRRPHLMSLLMLTMEQRTNLQSRTLAALAENPALFQSLVAVHVGASEFHHLCSWRLLDFGRAFLAA